MRRLKRALNATLVFDGLCHVVVVVKKSVTLFFLFIHIEKNCLGMPGENKTVVGLKFSEIDEYSNFKIIRKLLRVV